MKPSPRGARLDGATLCCARCPRPTSPLRPRNPDALQQWAEAHHVAGRLHDLLIAPEGPAGTDPSQPRRGTAHLPRRPLRHPTDARAPAAVAGPRRDGARLSASDGGAGGAAPGGARLHGAARSNPGRSRPGGVPEPPHRRTARAHAARAKPRRAGPAPSSRCGCGRSATRRRRSATWNGRWSAGAAPGPSTRRRSPSCCSDGKTAPCAGPSTGPIGRWTARSRSTSSSRRWRR